MKKRIFALALALCLMLSLVPTMAFAEGTCTHTHSDECYYTKSCKHTCTVAECGEYFKDCKHECSVESGCITMKKDCMHTHNADCGYKAAVEEVKCDCPIDEDGTITHTDDCGYVAPVAETPCKHVCSIENGCYKPLCAHVDGGAHDEECGYKETTLTTAAPTGLQQQINDAEENGTVKLEKDEVLTATLNVTKSITLDLNGHDIKLGEDMESAIQLEEGVSISITNSSSATPGTIYGTNEIKATDRKEEGKAPIGVYAVTFKKEYGKIYATRYVQSGHTVSGFSELEKLGYTPTWTHEVLVAGNTDEDGNKVEDHYETRTYDFSTEVTKNIVLTAKYEPITYSIIFDKNGGEGKMSILSMTYDVEVSLTENAFIRDGFDFTGWNTKADGTGTHYDDEATVKNLTATAYDEITLYAQWKVKEVTPATVTVTFDANGGKLTGDASTTVNKGGKLVSLPEPTRTGYTFDGWYTEKDGGTEVTKDTTYSENTTIYAHWTANKYYVKFDGNGNKDVSGTMKQQQMTYDAETTLTKNGYSREGYTFANWNTKADGTGQAYADGASVKNLVETPDGEITLYAQWVKDSTPELTPVTSLTFYQSGYEYNEKVIDLKLQSSTGNKGIAFPYGLKYGDDFGLSTEQNLASASKVTKGEIKAETQYFLYVEFQAAQGYTLNGLKPDNVKLDGTSAKTLTVKEETATAVFELPRIFLIKATAGSNGKIEPSGTVAVFEGENQTFTITPNTGYGISTMKIDKKSQTTKKTYTFKDVDDSHEIAVTFAKSNGSAKTGDDLWLIWLAGAGVLSLAALVAIVIIHNKKKNSK